MIIYLLVLRTGTRYTSYFIFTDAIPCISLSLGPLYSVSLSPSSTVLLYGVTIENTDGNRKCPWRMGIFYVRGRYTDWTLYGA
jgi:hypothetical protein